MSTSRMPSNGEDDENELPRYAIIRTCYQARSRNLPGPSGR